MSGYTLTITTYGPQSGAQTTINVDTASGSPRITELRVRPADGTGLSPDQLPVVDLPALILALTPPAAGSAVAPAAVTAAPEPAPAPAAATRARTPRGRAASTPPAPAAGPRRGGRRTPEPAAEDRGSRAYRRMPDQDEVVAAYRQSGGATALARHFGVPRHTANGWLRRLRSLGLIETTS